MNDHDPKGFYRVLGVRHDAPASVIRAAYKTLAKELHPDYNKNPNATADFQLLQQAYETLSNDETRRAYDGDAEIPHSDVGYEDDDSPAEAPEQLQPVRCSKCSGISAQPRFKVFYRVFGYLAGATKTPHQGVFCSRCETKEALRCSAFTLVLGWWSLHGFFYTLEALFHNLIGGRYYEQTAKLQAHQAFYFAQTGQLPLARAVALSALGFVEQARDKNLGPKDADASRPIRDLLTNFIESLPSDTKRVTLKSTSDFANRRFGYQIVLLATAIFAVIGLMYADERQAVQAEQTRLEQAGIERQRASAIARQEADTLRKLEQPLPVTGRFSGSDLDSASQPLPATGLLARSYSDSENDPPFKVINSPDSHTFLKLVDRSTGAEILAAFIRAGDELKVSVPVGTYEAKLASGQTWYGEAVRFGPKTAYAKLDKLLTFTIRGDELLGHAVTLTAVTNGNLTQSKIAATDF